MSDEVYVCKHCGSENIFAEIEARGWVGGGVAVDNKGQPYFESDGRPDYDEYDETMYRCGDCEGGHWKLSALIKVKEAEDELRGPCGRCDHGVVAHPLPERSDMAKYPEYYTRPAMRCTVEGCDCHDYYDLAIANAGLVAEAA